jgi:hypothetical protein
MRILLTITAFYPGSDPARLILLGAALFIVARAVRWLDVSLAARHVHEAVTRRLATKPESLPEIRLRSELRLRRGPSPNVKFPEHVGSD